GARQGIGTADEPVLQEPVQGHEESGGAASGQAEADRGAARRLRGGASLLLGRLHPHRPVKAGVSTGSPESGYRPHVCCSSKYHPLSTTAKRQVVCPRDPVMHAFHVLIANADPLLMAACQLFLVGQQVDVTAVTTASACRASIQHQTPDLLVIDPE